jgi:hypothetical protein
MIPAVNLHKSKEMEIFYIISRLSELSKKAGKVWNMMTENKKDHFVELAKLEKQNIRLKVFRLHLLSWRC